MKEVNHFPRMDHQGFILGGCDLYANNDATLVIFGDQILCAHNNVA
jgi:hypothetical protein